MGTRIGMRDPFDLPPLARVRCRLPRGRYRLRSNALRGLARIHWWRHSWLILICGSAGRSTFSRPSMQFGCPSLAQRVHDPFEQRVVRHAHGLAWLSGALFGLVLRGHGRVERTGRPHARLQPFRPVGAVGPVLVGREPRAASRLAADRGLAAAHPQRDLAHAEPVTVPQLVDPDAFLCRQVGIGFHIECNAFSSVVDLNTSNHTTALHFYLRTREIRSQMNNEIA